MEGFTVLGILSICCVVVIVGAMLVHYVRNKFKRHSEDE